jgi:hypothetical protein
MENTELHAQKVTILSRLIKESSLTLEEALLLLKEEEKEEITFTNASRSSTAIYPPIGTWSTTPAYMPSFISTTGGTINNTIAGDSADLNN